MTKNGPGHANTTNARGQKTDEYAQIRERITCIGLTEHMGRRRAAYWHVKHGPPTRKRGKPPAAGPQLNAACKPSTWFTVGGLVEQPAP